MWTSGANRALAAKSTKPSTVTVGYMPATPAGYGYRPVSSGYGYGGVVMKFDEDDDSEDSEVEL